MNSPRLSVTPTAAPAPASPPGYSILVNAVNPDVDKAVFNVVEGDQVVDPAFLPFVKDMLKKSVAPADKTKIRILDGSKDAKSTHAIFNTTNGTQYGFPQSQFNTNTSAAAKPTPHESQESELESLR